MIKTLFPVICVDDIRSCRDFYIDLFGFDIVFESDWYVQLVHPGNESVQLAFVERHHASVPPEAQSAPQGVLVTVELEDVDRGYARAAERELAIVVPLQDEEWGQRHFITRDPSGLLVDAFTMIDGAGGQAQT